MGYLGGGSWCSSVSGVEKARTLGPAPSYDLDSRVSMNSGPICIVKSKSEMSKLIRRPMKHESPLTLPKSDIKVVSSTVILLVPPMPW